MRLWLLTTARSTALTQSAAISLVTHVVLVSAAVYGTDRAATALAERLDEQVIFLAPPDRLPSSRGAGERVRFINTTPLDAGGRLTSALATEHTSRKPHDHDADGDGDAAADQGQAAQAEIVSDDSVYSVLSSEESATRVDGSAAPVYPAEMLREGIEGVVVARFVIDTTGRADPSSLQVLQSSHPAFVISVRDAVPGMRFTPATVRGRHVRQLVQQSFAFRLQIPTVAAEHTGTRTTP